MMMSSYISHIAKYNEVSHIAKYNEVCDELVEGINRIQKHDDYVHTKARKINNLPRVVLYTNWENEIVHLSVSVRRATSGVECGKLVVQIDEYVDNLFHLSYGSAEEYVNNLLGEMG